MSNIVYLNGRYVKEDEAKISVFDRGFIFGDGIYEVVPVLEGVMIDLKPFFERFERSMREISLSLGFTRKEIQNIINTLIEKNTLIEGGVYLQVTRGVAPRNFPFPKGLTPTFFVFCFEKNLIDNPYAQTGVKAVSVQDIRWKRRDIKSTSLLAQCIAKEEATQKGAYEGVMVEDGLVTEGVSSTLYIIKNSKLITRPLSNKVLPGIRRQVLLNLAKEEGLKVEERAFNIDEALSADEMFMSSATTFVLPIVELDSNKIADGKPGKITTKMRKCYIEAALKEAKSSGN